MPTLRHHWSADQVTREPVGVALTSPADLQLHPNTIAQPGIFVVPRVEPLEWRPAGASEPLTINLPVLFEQIWSDYRAIGG